LILGFAKALLDRKINYNTQLIVTATDVDLKCVHMCFVQLSLYGIPAVVIHGNSITLQDYSHWFTPFYITGGWLRRAGHVSNLDKLKVQAPPAQE
jgi:hypothetical protein